MNDTDKQTLIGLYVKNFKVHTCIQNLQINFVGVL